MNRLLSKKLKGKKVLITGGAGFLGSHLTDSFLEGGATALVLDDLSTGSRANLTLALKSPSFEFVKGDANDEKTLDRLFRKFRPDYAVHYAALVGVKRTQEQPLAVLADLPGIASFFALAKKYRVKKVAYASSSEVYGEPLAMPNREDDPLNPKTTYGVVKATGEEFVKAYSDLGLPGVALRFFNVYGPRQDSTSEGFVVGRFIDQVLHGQRPAIFGDGQQTRDFIYVDDNVEAVVRAIVSPNTDGEVINIVRGRPCTIHELARRVIAAIGSAITPKYIAPRIAGEIRYRHADGSKMRKLLNFEPRVSLEDGLRKTIEWHENLLS